MAYETEVWELWPACRKEAIKKVNEKTREYVRCKCFKCHMFYKWYRNACSEGQTMRCPTCGGLQIGCEMCGFGSSLDKKERKRIVNERVADAQAEAEAEAKAKAKARGNSCQVM